MISSTMSVNEPHTARGDTVRIHKTWLPTLGQILPTTVEYLQNSHSQILEQGETREYFLCSIHEPLDIALALAWVSATVFSSKNKNHWEARYEHRATRSGCILYEGTACASFSSGPIVKFSRGVLHVEYKGLYHDHGPVSR